MDTVLTHAPAQRHLAKLDAVYTHCDWHLGDHLLHLLYLRRLAIRHPEQKFVHAAAFVYLPQLIEVVADLANISLIDLEYRPSQSEDVWKNRDDYYLGHPKFYDFTGYYIEFFERISNILGFENPIKTSADFLFDYPAIKKIQRSDVDFLVINSSPMSGQFDGYSSDHFNWLIGLLLERGYSLLTTAPTPYDIPCTQTQQPALSVSAIGGASLSCKYIVGVATGPIWPTFNVWNTESVLLRVLLLDGERVFISPNTEHAETMPELVNILRERDLL